MSDNPILKWATNTFLKGSLIQLQGYNLVIDMADTDIAPRTRENRVWEPKSTKKLTELLELEPIRTFVDCGAHWGYYTCLAAKKVAKVYAFEANPQTHMLLSFNIVLNDLSNVRPLLLTLWDTPAALDFLPESATTGGSHVIGLWQPWSRGLQVNATTLDAIFDSNDEVDFLKVDCEGSDDHILRGAKHILSTNHPKLMVEHPNIPWLESLGYKATDHFEDEQVWFLEHSSSL